MAEKRLDYNDLTNVPFKNSIEDPVQIFLKTSFYSRRAVDLLIVLTSFDVRLKDFIAIPVYLTYRDQNREVIENFSYSLYRRDFKLPRKIRLPSRLFDFRSYNENALTKIIRYILIWRAYSVLKLMDENNKRHMDVRITINDHSLGISIKENRKISFDYEEIQFIKDSLNGYALNDLLKKYNNEMIKTIIGTPADPFISQLRTNLILESQELERQASEELKFCQMEYSEIRNNRKIKSKIKNTCLKSINNLWKKYKEDR